MQAVQVGFQEVDDMPMRLSKTLIILSRGWLMHLCSSHFYSQNIMKQEANERKNELYTCIHNKSIIRRH